jgi:hypothetical protein
MARGPVRLLFHLISKLYENTSLLITTNLAFAGPLCVPGKRAATNPWTLYAAASAMPSCSETTRGLGCFSPPRAVSVPWWSMSAMPRLRVYCWPPAGAGWAAFTCRPSCAWRPSRLEYSAALWIATRGRLAHV